MAYLTERFPAAERRLIAVAALLLLPVFFLPVLPIWTMRMRAPQYPEGLTLAIYVNDIRGDIQKINTLNHYVGMKAIAASDFKEFTYMPQALSLFGLGALLAALLGRRWIAALGWLAFTAFAAYLFLQFGGWLYRYGHELDPRAAIKLPAFTPPLIGFKQMANFKVWSLPGPGTILLGVAWALGPVIVWLDRRRAANGARTAGHAAKAGSLAACATLLLLASPGDARTLRAAASAGAAERAVQAAAAGDTVLLARGTHPGPLHVGVPVVLRGEPGAVVHGAGNRSVITVSAPGATLEDVEVRASGRRVLTIDAGVRVVSAADVTLRRVRLEDVLYGVYAERSDRLLLEGCVLRGRVKPRDESGEGNGVHLWTSADAVIADSDASGFLDAIYLSFAHRARVERGRFHDNGRYGLHTMYCQATALRDSQFDRNVAGIAIMFSNQLEVTGNRIVRNRGPRTYGLLLRDCSDGRFAENQLVDNTVALFLDGSNRNRFEHNLVQDNGWGVLMFASCAKNVFAANDFIANDHPVALDMRRTDNAFDDGARGNHWSEAHAWDLDGDGVGDAPHGPVTAFSFVSKQYPDLAVLANSPAVAVLGVAERVFPALSPSTVSDRFPRVAPIGGRAGARPLEAEPPARGLAVGFGATWLAALAGLVVVRRRG